MNKEEITGALADKAQELAAIGRHAMAEFLNKIASAIEENLTDAESAD